MPPTTRLSTKAYYERQAPDALRTDQPMDSGGAWTLMDNILHMVDESGQYRMNWITTNPAAEDTEDDIDSYGDLTNEGTWFCVFPGQAVLDDRYPRYDIRVLLIAAGDPDQTVRISLTTLGMSPPVIDDQQAGVIGSHTATIAGGDTIQWVEFLITTSDTGRTPFYAEPAPSASSETPFVGSHLLFKLIVEFVSDPGPESGQILGVQVREYLR